jgi:hypothetical protein
VCIYYLEKIQFCKELEIAHAALKADKVFLLVLKQLEDLS